MTRQWEAFWVFFSTGYDDPKRKSIGEDSTLTRAGRRRDGSYCGLPACLRDGGQATCPQIPGTDLKVLGFTTSVPRSRATVPCLPAGRGCFPCRRLGSYHQPAATGGGLGGNNTAEPRTPPRPGLEAVAAVLHGQAGPPRATRYIPITQCERHQSDCSHYICSSRPLSGSAPAWVKASPRCPTHRLRGGDDGLPVYRSSAVLGVSEDISLLPLALNIVRSE
jgi:hypothetical protein